MLGWSVVIGSWFVRLHARCARLLHRKPQLEIPPGSSVAVAVEGAAVVGVADGAAGEGQGVVAGREADGGKVENGKAAVFGLEGFDVAQVES